MLPRPLVVVEGPTDAIAADLAAARAAGFEIVASFRRATPRTQRPIVRTGAVATDADAADALLAALDGAGLIVAATAGRATIDRLVDDLRRLGRVDHRVAADVARSAPALTREGRAILGLLAEGLSLGEAAEALGLARRTADRRLAEARRALGTERTTEAITHARRLGWLAPTDLGDR